MASTESGAEAGADRYGTRSRREFVVGCATRVTAAVLAWRSVSLVPDPGLLAGCARLAVGLSDALWAELTAGRRDESPYHADRRADMAVVNLAALAGSPAFSAGLAVDMSAATRGATSIGFLARHAVAAADSLVAVLEGQG